MLEWFLTEMRDWYYQSSEENKSINFNRNYKYIADRL